MVPFLGLHMRLGEEASAMEPPRVQGAGATAHDPTPTPNPDSPQKSNPSATRNAAVTPQGAFLHDVIGQSAFHGFSFSTLWTLSPILDPPSPRNVSLRHAPLCSAILLWSSADHVQLAQYHGLVYCSHYPKTFLQSLLTHCGSAVKRKLHMVRMAGRSGF